MTSQYNSLYALREDARQSFPSPRRLDGRHTHLNTARRVDEDADVDALILSSRRARRPLTRARRLLVLMRVIKTKKKSSHTVWSLTDVARVVLACVIAAFVVVCASRAMGGASIDSSTDAWSTRDSLRDVDARAFGKDPDACARAASIGTWRRGAEACEGGPRVGERRVRRRDAVLARVREKEISLGRENVGDELESERNVWIRTVASDRARVQGERVDRRQARGVRRGLGARRAYGAFIAAMSDERADVSLETKDGEKHRDWAHELVGGARATFTWAPYASDATTALEKYASASETPDLIVLSSSLWHVLHDNSVSTYKSAMKTLGARAREMTAMKPNVVFVWLDAPKIVTDALVADDKRAKFTEKNFEKFFKVRDDQKTTALVAPAGPAIRVRATDVTARAAPTAPRTACTTNPSSTTPWRK